jgi:glycosyltransferase involved in cell wall biosynthesis
MHPERPTILIVHKDHRLKVNGVNSGAENATLQLARHLTMLGRRVVVAAYLPDGECSIDGVDYWDTGELFDNSDIIKRVRSLGDYVVVSAGRAHPIYQTLGDSNCVGRYLICHEPTAAATGVNLTTLSKLVNKVICVSQAQADLFIKAGLPASSIQVIHNGVDLERFKPNSDAKRDPYKLLFAGALVVDKGIHLAVEAYAALKSEFPQLSFDVYGSAGLWGREPLFDEGKLEQQLPGLKFHGAVSQEQLATAFTQAGLMLVPSIWFDAFNLTAAEAQASGCPVVAFDSGGLSEVVSHGLSGLVVSEISKEALIKHIAALLRNPAEMSRLSDQASVWARARFDWTLTAKQVVKLLDSDQRVVQATIPSGETVIFEGAEKISIGIPTYNRKEFLLTALESLRGQLAFIHEILVVDDGSTDGTAELLAELKLPKLRVIKHRRNSGRPAARNTIVDNFSGDALVWLDDDDALTEGALLHLQSVLAANPEADILYGDLVSCNDKLEPSSTFLKYNSFEPATILMHLVFENIFPNGGSTIRRRVFEKVGAYDARFVRSQDYHFWARAALAKCRFLHHGRAIYLVRMHSNNLANPLVTRDQSAQQCQIVDLIVKTAHIALPLEIYALSSKYLEGYP